MPYRHSGSIAIPPPSTAAMLSSARKPMALRVSTDALPVRYRRAPSARMRSRMLALYSAMKS